MKNLIQRKKKSIASGVHVFLFRLSISSLYVTKRRATFKKDILKFTFHIL